MIHRSLKVEEAQWQAMTARAKSQGFTSTNSYVRFLFAEAINAGTAEEAEDRIANTISRLSARVQSVGTMHQATFALLWGLCELQLGLSEERLRQLRERVAGHVRGNTLLKELSE